LLLTRPDVSHASLLRILCGHLTLNTWLMKRALFSWIANGKCCRSACVYFNRGVVLYKLKRHEECIFDMEIAFMLGYTKLNEKGCNNLSVCHWLSLYFHGKNQGNFTKSQLPCYSIVNLVIWMSVCGSC
jgi:hypothetical protein